LKGATYLLEHGGRQATASNKIFEQSLDDYRKALADFSEALSPHGKEGV